MQEVEGVYQRIAPELTAMEELACRSLSLVDPFVEDVVRYSFRFGGKRLRPVLLFLAGKATGELTDRHIRMAAAIEFVHTATLIHDDILDGASIRRHLATVNVRWNSQIGVLAGDLLLARAMELMTADEQMYGFRRLSVACRQTCEGELRQIGTINRFEMTREEYFEMIAGKTAPLLACSTELGAWASGAPPETVERLRLFGHKLGLAFQVIDDILDLVGETDTAGKTLRTDLVNRKPTLPLILMLSKLGAPERRETIALLRKDDFNEREAASIIERLRGNGAIAASRTAADDLIDEAIESIADLDADREAIDGLVSIARYIGNRKQ